MTIGAIGSELSSLEFDPVFCANPSVVNVSGTIYAVAYRGEDGDGFVKTFSIDSDGIIGAVIDTLEFETTDCWGPVILNVSGNIFAVVYQESVTNDGWVATMEIDSSGNIGAAIIDSAEFTTQCDQDPAFINISGTIFAMAYSGSGNDGFLTTISIATDGTIGAVIDNLEFDTAFGADCELIKISGDIYAVVYRGNTYDIVTVEIDSSGNITNTIVDGARTTGNDMSFLRSSVVHVSGTTYAIVSSNGDNDGELMTVTITDAGTITVAAIDLLEFETTDCRTPHIIKLGGNIFAIAYRYAVDNDGFMVTVRIDISGSIDDAVLDSKEFDTSQGGTPWLFQPSSGIIAVAYGGPSTDGFVKTFGVTVPVVFPSDALLRASGIRRSFWAGIGGQSVYQCELALGGMTTSYVSPIGSRDIPSAVTPSPVTNPLRAYINRLPPITETGIPGVTMPFTTTAPTAPQMAEYAGMGKTEYDKIIQQGKVTKALREFGPITGPGDLAKFKARYPGLL